MSKILLYRYYDSPVGRLMIGELGGIPAVCTWIDTPSHNQILKTIPDRLNAEYELGDSVTLQSMATWLDEYFSGKKPGIPEVLITGSDFKQRILRTLCSIPYGKTVSYSELARMSGFSTATRAVATAVAKNPLSIFIPCHRVIRADGSPGCYAGSSDSKKLYLLSLESKTQ